MAIYNNHVNEIRCILYHMQVYYTSRENRKPLLANQGLPFRSVVLTRQCADTLRYILRLLMKGFLPLPVTLGGDSASHQSFLTLTSSKTEDSLFCAAATGNGLTWSATTLIFYRCGLCPV